MLRSDQVEVRAEGRGRLVPLTSANAHPKGYRRCAGDTISPGSAGGSRGCGLNGNSLVGCSLDGSGLSGCRPGGCRLGGCYRTQVVTYTSPMMLKVFLFVLAFSIDALL